MSCTLTIIGDTHPTAAAGDAALRRARDALTAAELRGRPVEIVQALARLARCYRRRQSAVVAEALLEQALTWSRASASTDLVVAMLCELCEFAVGQATGDDEPIPHAAEKALAWGGELAQLAPRVADPVFETNVLRRLARLLERLGERSGVEPLRRRVRELLEPPDTPAGSWVAEAHPTLQ